MNIWPSLMQALGQTFRTDPTSKALELKIGEVVHATLIDIMDDHSAVLQIKGQTLRAQLETQLPRGAVVPLVVIGPTENGILELKVSPFVLDRTLVEAGVSFPQSTGLDKVQSLPLEKLLQNLELKDTQITRQIVSRLLAAEISVTPSLVNTIEALHIKTQQELTPTFKSIGQPSQPMVTEQGQTEAENIRTATSIESLVQMVRKNLPLSLTTFQAMKTVWYGPSLSEILTRAFPPSTSANETFSAKLVGAQQGFSLADFILELKDLEELPAKERGPALEAIVNRLGLSHEHQLGLLQKGVDVITPDTLKAWLLAELQNSPVQSTVEQALHHLTGQQLMHSTKDDPSPFFYQYLSLPILVERETADAKIHLLTRKKAGKRLDPYNCFLYFHLQLPSLGDLGLHVQIVERMVSLRFILEEEHRIALDETDLSVLRQGLQQAGYQLGIVRKETGASNSVSPFSQLPVLVTNGMLDLRI